MVDRLYGVYYVYYYHYYLDNLDYLDCLDSLCDYRMFDCGCDQNYHIADDMVAVNVAAVAVVP